MSQDMIIFGVRTREAISSVRLVIIPRGTLPIAAATTMGGMTAMIMLKKVLCLIKVVVGVQNSEDDKATTK